MSCMACARLTRSSLACDLADLARWLQDPLAETHSPVDEILRELFCDAPGQTRQSLEEPSAVFEIAWLATLVELNLLP